MCRSCPFQFKLYWKECVCSLVTGNWNLMWVAERGNHESSWPPHGRCLHASQCEGSAFGWDDKKILPSHVRWNERRLPEGDPREPSQASGGSPGRPAYSRTWFLTWQLTNLPKNRRKNGELQDELWLLTWRLSVCRFMDTSSGIPVRLYSIPYISPFLTVGDVRKVRRIVTTGYWCKSRSMKTGVEGERGPRYLKK